MTTATHNRYDADTVKQAAQGRWQGDILPAFGFNQEDLDGRHHPCPLCAGTNRFRLVDEDAGAVLCNQCFNSNNGDGLAAIQWLKNWTFPETIKAVAEHLGVAGGDRTHPHVSGSASKSSESSDPFLSQFFEFSQEKNPEFVKIIGRALEDFAKSKPPITPDAILATGAKVVTWPNSKEHGQRCLAFPAFNRRDELTGYILRRVDGSEFSAFGPLQDRKTHMLRGSHDGWVIPGGFDRVAQADFVWRVEGVPDALALFPFLPSNHAVITNICGAMSSPKNLDILAEKTVYVCGDADTPGQEGAIKFAGKILNIATQVKIVPLPYAVSETHGQDLRDYFSDGHTLEELLAVAEAAPDFEKPKRARAAKRPESHVEPPDDVDEWTYLPCAQGQTDRANSRRFLKAYGDRVRFVFPWGKWLVWDGSRWQIDDGGAVMRLAMAISDQVWMDAKDYMRLDGVVDFAVSTSGHGKLSAMLKLAAADVSVSVDELDAKPWLLNCTNGTVDLRTGELRPHRREDLLTKLCPTNFNGDAASMSWDRFLDSVFNGHDPTIAFLQRFAGYCLTGDVSEQVLAVFYGVGSNGKSTLLNALQTTLGTDFTSAAPPSLLMEKRGETHPTELAGLFGKRLVIAQETNQGARMAESTVKQLTGGDIISARRMREDFWTFSPSHKLVMATNHKPKIKGTDHAIWRRLLLVPFARKFWNPAKGETGPDDLRQDKALPEKLAAEREGILAWMVCGCLAWQRDGLQVPDSIRAATECYRSEQDVLGRYVDECCLTGQAYKVKFSDIYGSLETWCNESGDNLPSRMFVGQWLKDSGYRDKHSTVRWYLGIALKED